MLHVWLFQGLASEEILVIFLENQTYVILCSHPHSQSCVPVMCIARGRDGVGGGGGDGVGGGGGDGVGGGGGDCGGGGNGSWRPPEAVLPDVSLVRPSSVTFTGC